MKNLASEIPAIVSSSAKRVVRILALPALILVFSIMPAAADDHACSNATLEGVYAYAVGGPSLTIPPVGPIAILGKITLNGRGSFKGTANGSIVGTIIADMPITGTYSVASDCTGTLTTVYPAFTGHFSFVLVEAAEGRRQAELLGTDAGTVTTGTLKRVTDDCDHF